MGKAWDGTNPSTYVVAAADRPIDMQEMNKVVSAINGGRGIYGEYLEDSVLQAYIADSPTLITDDYAPIDNMVAMLFARPR